MAFFHPASNFTDDTVCLSVTTKTSSFCKEHYNFNKKLQYKYKEEYSKNVTYDKQSFYQLKYTEQLVDYFNQFNMAGYGFHFTLWCKADIKKPYYSLGNGALMRISSFPFIFDSLDECLMFCDMATQITHNHPESIKMTHLYMEILWYLLHSVDSIETKKQHILDLSKKYELFIDSVQHYHELKGFNVLANETLKRSVASVIESDSFKKTMQNVLFIGSDTDTTASIAGAMAELLFGIDDSWINLAIKKFDHKNIVLLKNISSIYLLKENYSEYVKDILFNSSKINLYKKIKELVLKDPTAEWDPLELDEHYYTDTDIKLQEKYKRETNLFYRLKYWIENNKYFNQSRV